MTHRLVEYQSSRIPLAQPDLEYLLDLTTGSTAEDEARLIRTIAPTKTAGLYDVQPGPFVGRLGLPSGSWMELESRFPFEDSLELIRLSGRLPVRLDRLLAAAGERRFLIDLLAEVFAREVERIVSFGLAKGYQSRRFIRPPYPGRIDVAEHIRRFGARPEALVTSAKRITYDIPLNRALAVALDILTRVPLNVEVARSLSRMRASFARVSRPPMSADSVAKLPFDRLTVRYRDAIGLAELVLRSQSLAPRSTQLAGASIVFHMPKVWESYVTRWVRQEWHEEYRVEAPHTFDLTNDGAIRSEADVTVLKGDRVVAIYDAKYKWGTKGPSTGDIYQMVTYCKRLGPKEATLVYPGPFESATYTIGDVAVRLVGLPVMRLVEPGEATSDMTPASEGVKAS